MVSIFETNLNEQIALAIEKRNALQSFQVLDVRDIERKQDILEEAEIAMDHVLRGCDFHT